MTPSQIQKLRELAVSIEAIGDTCSAQGYDSDEACLACAASALRACADREEMAQAEDKPTREQLMELFDYDRLSGSLVRKVAQSNRSAGEKVGCLDHEGYLRTVINGRLYRNHHLVWTYWYGMFSTFQIDHINRVKTDNRIENLRAANRELQSQNTSLRLDSKTGYKGVVFHKRMGKYQAQYKMNKVLHHVGYFDTPEDAHEALMKHKKANNHPDAIDHALQSAALALQGDRPNASGISRGMAAELAEREATEHADAMSPYRDRRWDDVWLQEFAESYVERVTPLGTPQAIAADLSRAIGDEKC